MTPIELFYWPTPNGWKITIMLEELLVPALRAGRPVYTPPPLADTRARAQEQLARLDPAVRRLAEPASYPVALDRNLADLKDRVMARARGATS